MGCLLVTALYNFFYRSAADHPINWLSLDSHMTISPFLRTWHVGLSGGNELTPYIVAEIKATN
jgi:hypothetical protein